MRLLFDQNLSYRLNHLLRDLFPESLHVRDAGLVFASDHVIWAHAKEHQFTIVSKDSDFRQLSFTYGQPPKVVWIRRGNCSTSEIAGILRERFDEILAFLQDEESSFLALS